MEKIKLKIVQRKNTSSRGRNPPNPRSHRPSTSTTVAEENSPFELEPLSLEEIRHLSHSERKYRRLMIENINMDYNFLSSELIKSIAHHVEVLEISECTININSEKTFRMFLSFFQNLKDLLMFKVGIESLNDKTSKNSTCPIKKLNSLALVECEISLFRFLKNFGIQSSKILIEESEVMLQHRYKMRGFRGFFTASTEISETRINGIHFLNNQKSLEALGLKFVDIGIENIFETINKLLKKHENLKSLSINLDKEPNRLAAITQFLNRYKEQLVEFEWESKIVSQLIIETMLIFSRLERLKIKCQRFSHIDDDSDSLLSIKDTQQNTNLKFLVIQCSENGEYYLEKLFRAFPAIKFLIINVEINACIVSAIASRLKSLQYLKIANTRDLKPHELPLESISTLKILHLSDYIPLCKASIETLIVDEWNMLRVNPQFFRKATNILKKIYLRDEDEGIEVCSRENLRKNPISSCRFIGFQQSTSTANCSRKNSTRTVNFSKTSEILEKIKKNCPHLKIEKFSLNHRHNQFCCFKGLKKVKIFSSDGNNQYSSTQIIGADDGYGCFWSTCDEFKWKNRHYVDALQYEEEYCEDDWDEHQSSFWE